MNIAIESAASAAAPYWNSAHAAALASFSTTTGTDTCRATSSRSGSLRHARFGANSTVARLASIQPAAPMPIASTSYAVVSSVITSMIRARVREVSCAGVSRRACARTVPSGSTTPPSTFVPPMSTPKVNPTAALSLQVPRNDALPAFRPARPRGVRGVAS